MRTMRIKFRFNELRRNARKLLKTDLVRFLSRGFDPQVTENKLSTHITLFTQGE
jgi:hypothetical protein